MAVRKLGRTPYKQQIADDLREQIADGSLSPGDQLPTEAELEKRYGVARGTVRQGIEILINEGLVVSARPKGHFVRERKPMVFRPQAEFRPRPYTPEMDAFMTESSADGREARQTIEVSIVEAPAEVAKRLQLDAGQLVAVRRRVRFLDGEPFNINDSYFPLDLVQDSEIMRPQNITQGANEVLADLGYRQVRALDELYVRMPTPEEVKRLDLSPGTPVGYHVCTGFTEEGKAVRVAVTVLPGDRHVVSYERRRETDPAS
ncbi:GntR family transcriptional regulator [Actinacidiphila acidipaludis]|uniref:GntR family transcriptional regulator n=1 Tax=Actinacidiphila acidipaludis TaxID=2873382 RepID=A0ABS7Q7F5_9ACTN|nr:GntR family transcriptional regulator [Streptomyces acidipaludis]MBY8879097.1 GntR family transcriptional regulator [Streptomyces acidipaludis]